jgi:hypothetical protein
MNAENIATLLREEVVEQGIKPNRHAISAIAERGEIAVVAYQAHPLASETLRVWGCVGEPVFALRLNPATRRATFRGEDPRVAKWIDTCPAELGAQRILVLDVLMPIFVNFTPSQGYSVDPCSLAPALT